MASSKAELGARDDELASENEPNQKRAKVGRAESTGAQLSSRLRTFVVALIARKKGE